MIFCQVDSWSLFRGIFMLLCFSVCSADPDYNFKRGMFSPSVSSALDRWTDWDGRKKSVGGKA